jgi:hypothetical protein
LPNNGLRIRLAARVTLATTRLALDLALISPSLSDSLSSARYAAAWPMADIDEQYRRHLRPFANGGSDVWISWNGRAEWQAKQTKTLSDHAALVIDFGHR